MERLTYKHDDKWCISGINGKLISDKHANYWGEAIDRLASYENAGIEPCDYTVVRASYEEAERAKKDLSNVMDILGGYSELIKANKDNRILVLPFKVGDTIYDIYNAVWNKGIVECEIDERKVTSIDIKLDSRNKPWFIVDNCMFTNEDFGETAFLSKEEAEAALKNI
jgi:hypothetical protein